MNTKAPISGTFEGCTIVPELNENQMPIAYHLLRDNDEQATLPVHVGSPAEITGFTTEDIISVAIDRLERLNAAVASPLNDIAITRLKESLQLLYTRFDITTQARNLGDDLKPSVVGTERIKKEKGHIYVGLFSDFLFVGKTQNALIENIRTAAIATISDLAKIVEVIEFNNLPFRYIGHDNTIMIVTSINAQEL